MNSQRGQYMSVQKFYDGAKTAPPSNLLHEPYVEHYSPPPPQLNPPIRAGWEKVGHVNTADPSIWGPAFWFSLHNGASKYPIQASPICAQRMKGVILGLPYILPCENCSDHARAHIAQNERNIDDICSGRDKLFRFFVDMHNMVNARSNKPQLSIEDAYKIYSNQTPVERFTYST